MTFATHMMFKTMMLAVGVPLAVLLPPIIVRRRHRK